MKKKLSILTVLLLSFALLASACTGGAKDQNKAGAGADAAKETAKPNYAFKLGHIASNTHGWTKMAEKLGEELKTRSNGRMKLDIFPAGQLGSEPDMVKQVESGTMDFAFITMAYLSTRVESLNGWFMPFLFKDLSEAVKMRDSASAKKMLKEVEKLNVISLDTLLIGNRHVLMKNGEVKSPEDLKGKKLRIIGSPVIQDFWKAVGAAPTAMPLPEVYTALQTGVIDGIDIDLDALVSGKYYEISKNLTLTNHMTFNGIAMMSKAKFDKMSPEDQKIVTEATKAAFDWGAKEAVRLEDANLKEVKAKGLTVSPLQNSELFKPVKDEINKKYSANPTIKEFIDEANKKK